MTRSKPRLTLAEQLQASLDALEIKKQQTAIRNAAARRRRLLQLVRK